MPDAGAGAGAGAGTQGFVPYAESALWRVHDAYYEERAAAAWTSGEVPYLATSGYPAARRAVRLVAALVRALEREGALDPGADLWVLEVGCGLGRFAENFFRALASLRTGARLAPRLRFALTDYVEGTVRAAARSPALRPLVRAGRIVPAVLDARAPDAALDALGAGPLVAAFASYLCCVLPVVALRKTRAGGFEEKLVALRADGARGVRSVERFRPVRLERALGDPVHARAVRAAVAPFVEARIAYPGAFLDFARALGRRMHRGGALVVTDFGYARRADLARPGDVEPAVYGRSLNHPVQFALVEAFAREAGLASVRTRAPSGRVHTVALRYGRPIPRPLRRTFARIYERRGRGRDLIELAAFAQDRLRAGDAAGAARDYRECLRREPRCPELALFLARALLHAGEARRALAWLGKGRRLDRAGGLDFDFELARAYARLGRDADAARALRRSFAREPS